MWQRVANFILRNRFFVLGTITLLTVFWGYYALNELKLDNKYGTILPKDSKATEEYKKFKEQLKDLGIDLDKLIDEKEKELINDNLEEKLKLMFAGKF
jgi:predicted RND superfamily exporter protein